MRSRVTFGGRGPPLSVCQVLADPDHPLGRTLSLTVHCTGIDGCAELLYDPACAGSCGIDTAMPEHDGSTTRIAEATIHGRLEQARDAGPDAAVQPGPALGIRPQRIPTWALDVLPSTSD